MVLVLHGTYEDAEFPEFVDLIIPGGWTEIFNDSNPQTILIAYKFLESGDMTSFNVWYQCDGDDTLWLNPKFDLHWFAIGGGIGVFPTTDFSVTDSPAVNLTNGTALIAVGHYSSTDPTHPSGFTTRGRSAGLTLPEDLETADMQEASSGNHGPFTWSASGDYVFSFGVWPAADPPSEPDRPLRTVRSNVRYW